MGWVGGQQKCYYCKVFYGMSLIKYQQKYYYRWVGGKTIAKNALRNLWMTPYAMVDVCKLQDTFRYIN